MKNIFTLFLFAMASLNPLDAQDFVPVPLGASYANQAYYNLNTDNIEWVSNESWDLAFTINPGTAGIFVNEATTASFTGEAPSLKLYLAPTTDFADPIDPATLTDSLYNEEVDWENGAFNNPREEGNSDDYGWGTYNATTQAIEGNRVYALNMRNGSWKKIFIESMANGAYKLKYANLNGDNEGTATIDKADFGDSPFALFSFGSGMAMASPSNWDLLFTRYQAALDPGSGVVVQYPVTGVLHGPGVQSAEARDVDPDDVDYEPYLDSLSSQLDIIGQDWKFFNLGELSWVIDLNRAYFVKTTENRLWKIVFYAFDGISSGIFTFEKTDLGLLSNTKSLSGSLSSLSTFPNPVVGEMTVSFTLAESREKLPLYLLNTIGQPVWRTSIQGQAGLNVLNLNPGLLASGIYYLVVGDGEDSLTQKVVVK